MRDPSPWRDLELLYDIECERRTVPREHGEVVVGRQEHRVRANRQPLCLDLCVVVAVCGDRDDGGACVAHLVCLAARGVSRHDDGGNDSER